MRFSFITLLTTIALAGLLATVRTASPQKALQRSRRLDEQTPGSGLGLAIVDELARLHGGTLELDESAWRGLRAALSLPAV